MQAPISDQEQPQDPNQLQVELSEDIAEGVFCNLAMIAHSNGEFVLDFIRVMPGLPKAKVKSRVVVTPEHALRLLNALQDNISRYEDAFGPIKRDDLTQIPFNFGGQIGQA
jgi:hypothetical protein